MGLNGKNEIRIQFQSTLLFRKMTLNLKAIFIGKELKTRNLQNIAPNVPCKIVLVFTPGGTYGVLLIIVLDKLNSFLILLNYCYSQFKMPENSLNSIKVSRNIFTLVKNMIALTPFSQNALFTKPSTS